MPDPKIYNLRSEPGTQRDGTDSASVRYNDTVWCRFQRGLPRKMGGYRQATAQMNGPVSTVLVWSRQGLNQITTFSPSGVEGVQVDNNGVGSSLFNRTPSAYAIDVNAVWQQTTMYDAAAGSTKTLVFGHAGSNMANIDNGTVSDVWYGDANATDALVAISPAMQISGGIVAIPPYLVTYGSDGAVNWSNTNEPRNFATGDSGSARVTGAKVVKGLPIRGQGQSPSALLWSLDSVIRMSYVGGQAIFRFDILSSQSSVLSSSGIIEYDGMYFWAGVDRFMTFNGTVQELPNDQNLNWFFDHLNYANRQMVHAVKVPRWGEIWWFYPRGSATYCTDAVIYNVREKIWYDVNLSRSAGAYSQVFKYPVMAEPTVNVTTYRLSVADASGFQISDTVTGATSATFGVVVKLLDNDVYVTIPDPALVFINGETVTGILGGNSAISSIPPTITIHSLWVHEVGKNKSQGDFELAIPSSFTLSDFGWLSGGPPGDAMTGDDRWLRLLRVEPDFNMTGPMTMEVIGQKTPNSPSIIDSTSGSPYTFDNTTERIDTREMYRIIALRFTSDANNGDYEMGRLRILAEEGDVRS